MKQPLSVYARPHEESPFHPDEPIYGFAELNLQPPDFKAMRRYQLLRVLRGDALVWIRIDMGLSSDWPSADEFRVVTNPDGDSIASVMAYADERRADMYWRKFLQEQAEASTLITDVVAWEEEKRKWRKQQSAFGPGLTRQRNI